MNLGPTEIIIIAVVVMLLFGFKRLPDASRSIGRSLRIFKAETKGLREDDVKAPAATADYTQTPDNEPSPLPAQTKTVEEQRLEAQRFLDATASPAPAPSVPPTQPR
ncbi:Sec-independent protein translocase subunit TatA [Rhodococcus antarcticus]|uniref:Sec-independent protein translocase protein TatA n=1 Tax=Rhodococcus antarcticus TaxID=2987751 RepID=A0ABY6P3U6_9NOCA|nr:Sec-independent protein translocase subunit TatA [Rhodococcus antarcticus]UZJ26322.1 Sec-independent protein translocase subunit TatA [Rhodococcus antarcticus]